MKTMTINNKELVLLIVDMQNGFLGRRSQHVLPSVVKLVDEFKRRGLPVVFTRFHNNPGSHYEQLIGWTRLRTSPETDLHPDLEPYANEVVDKDIYSAFTPSFSAMVEQNRWRTIAICGVATDGCVLKTAVDAFERNLVPLVISDACASHAGEDVHNAGLMLLGRFIGKQQIMEIATLLSKVDELNGNGAVDQP
jgi:nicotinamidase-related amidase